MFGRNHGKTIVQTFFLCKFSNFIRSFELFLAGQPKSTSNNLSYLFIHESRRQATYTPVYSICSICTVHTRQQIPVFWKVKTEKTATLLPRPYPTRSIEYNLKLIHYFAICCSYWGEKKMTKNNIVVLFHDIVQFSYKCAVKKSTWNIEKSK